MARRKADTIRPLTAKEVEGAAPKATRYEIRDGGAQGLYLVVQPSGTKAFQYRYFYAGKTRRMKLGVYPHMKLAQARVKAGECAGIIHDGGDPGRDRQKVEAVADGTVVGLVGAFIEEYAKLETRQWKETERILNRYVVTVIGRKRASMVTPDDIEEVVKKVGRPVMGNRTFAHARKMFNWGMSSRFKLPRNPCIGAVKMKTERSRDRKLSDDEIAAVWQATKALGYPFGPFFQVLLLTGQRRGEVARMEWSEIERGVWTIPPEKAKNDTEHKVPLPPECRKILDALPVTDGCPYVFTSNGKSPLSGFSKGKARMDRQIADTRQREGVDGDIEPWKVHDLRRTVAASLARLGVPQEVTEKVLNHLTGKISGVGKVYNVYEYMDERKDALERWEENVLALAGEGTRSWRPGQKRWFQEVQ
jgi:integrase